MTLNYIRCPKYDTKLFQFRRSEYEYTLLPLLQSLHWPGVYVHGQPSSLRATKYSHSSSSSCRAISADIPDPLSPHLPIVHCFWQVFRVTYRHRSAVCRFDLIVLPLLVHVKRSTVVHHLWARPYFSSIVPHVLFV